MKTQIIGVMACDPNGLIGSTQVEKLPWHYPEDTNFWKSLVKDKPLLMGYDTFQKLTPNWIDSHPIGVLSKHHQSPDPRVHFFNSIEALLESSFFLSTALFYHLGGAKTMNLFLETGLIDEFYLTEIKKVHEGDIFLNIENIQKWPTVCILENHDFRIMHYQNISRKI